jgi:hypothetical protein
MCGGAFNSLAPELRLTDVSNRSLVRLGRAGRGRGESRYVEQILTRTRSVLRVDGPITKVFSKRCE